MSLDVYLISKNPVVKKASSGIFIRDNGQTKEITQEEWNTKYPGQISVRFQNDEVITNRVYHNNITHNLGTMAIEAGIYKPLWRPEEVNITKAFELIKPLERGLKNLTSEPDKYKEFNSDNGWGTYELLVSFVEDYINACKSYPDADIEVSR